MIIPKRSGSVGSCHYGFQGQEKDDEIKGEGNSLNYKYRMHDPRVGRFFAPDPLEMQYPFYSPYQFSGNRPIDRVEREGLEPRKPTALATELPWYMPEGSTWTFYAIDNGELTKVHETKGITWEVEKLLWTSHDTYPHLVSKTWIEYDGEVYDATSLGKGATIGDLVEQQTLSTHLAKLTELQASLNSISERAEAAVGVASLVDGVKNIYKGWKAIKASRSFLSLKDFSNLPGGGTINPSKIRFSQNNISGNFKDGTSVADLTKGLKNGTIDPKSIPAIRIVEKNGKIFTLDNRRLKAFQDAGVDITL